MKSLFVALLCVGLAQSVFAEKDDSQKRVVDRLTFESYPDRAKRDSVNECEAKLAQMLNQVEGNLDSYFEKGFEYECKEIEISSETDFDSISHMGSMRRFWGSVDHKYTVEITVSCVPRKLSEKALFAMAKRCEENPTAACFNDELLSKLDNIGTTKFSYRHKGSTCKALD